VETLPVMPGMRVGRAAFKKGSIPQAVDMPPALSSCIAPFHLPSPRMGCTRVAFFLLLSEECDLVGVGRQVAAVVGAQVVVAIGEASPC
jgi:hypothetical protein